MSIRIGRYDFKGPYESPENLQHDAGIYAVIVMEKNRGVMLDVGESTDVKTRVIGHDRKKCWERLSSSRPLLYAAAYTSNIADNKRRLIEKEIRTQYAVPCGKS